MSQTQRRPNILLIMTDEERFPPDYEGEQVADWREQHLTGRNKIRDAAVSFTRHYAGSTACEPSRATLFTGQYPSLHGVSQTSGLAKNSSDPGLFWLPPNSVPTLGNWFRAGSDYRTFYHGKWHISDQDLIIPGSHNGLLTTDAEGNVYPEREALYRKANRLADYGFDGWIGPEPHGALANNAGLMRDPGFAQQTIDMLQQLEQEAATDADYRPWLAVCSFVNPHDIVFSGQSWQLVGLPEPDLSGIPVIDPPTRHEALCHKPRCQRDYVLNYGQFYYRQPTTDAYYQLYLYLQQQVDRQIESVYDALLGCPTIANDTVVIFTSDHGDVLGAHGGMHQKWYNAYDECIRVPLLISTPQQRSGGQSSHRDATTSHVDLLPTMLELAGIDAEAAGERLAQNHTEVHRPVGRSLLPLINGSGNDQPIYFMTDDEVDKGLSEAAPPKFTELYLATRAQNAGFPNPNESAEEGREGITPGGVISTELALGRPVSTRQQLPYRPVIQPHHIETVITRIDGTLYKLSRYFENPRFTGNAVGNPDGGAEQYFVPDEWELYDLDGDPEERDNLLSPCADKAPDAQLVASLKQQLREQRKAKRLLPTTLNRNATTA
ncbi:sulfatase-like hydrolase/transferase [Endothiovibrio diazotrophicus]